MGAAIDRMTNRQAGMQTGRPAGRFALALIVLALAMRLIVPTGWMPSADGRSITLCTAMGVVEAWVDADGDLHEKAPAKPVKAGEPCVFAAISAAVIAPDMALAIAPPAVAAAPLFLPTLTVAIGHGLAAPPPPPTGPPAIL